MSLTGHPPPDVDVLPPPFPLVPKQSFAHGRLYVRNDEEMVCYLLGPDATPWGLFADFFDTQRRADQPLH